MVDRQDEVWVEPDFLVLDDDDEVYHHKEFARRDEHGR